MQVQANYVAKVLELLGWKDSDDGGVEAGGNGGLSKKTLNTGGKKICPRIRGHQDYIIRPGYLGSGLRLIEVNVTKKTGNVNRGNLLSYD
mgnify:FL=1